MRAESAKQRRRTREYAKARAVAFDRARDGGEAPRCQARLPDCGGTATEGNHLCPRSRCRALYSDPDNIIPVCGPCHRWITANPAAATLLGLVVRSGETLDDARFRRHVSRVAGLLGHRGILPYDLIP